ncbi:hypothetical protein KKD70_03625 [Patescibacteria group bacterium]|nr:hypothetical protein [Patescibacteria group bacterium]
MKKPFTIAFTALLALTILIFLTVKATAPTGRIYMTVSPPLKLEIKIASLSDPFFGTAFHVNFDSQKYKFQNYSLGDFFTSQDDPLVLVEDNQDGIIMVGLCLKQGKTIKKENGTLLTLNFEPQQNQKAAYQNDFPAFAFSNTVFSTFNKNRQDIMNFTFENLP